MEPHQFGELFAKDATYRGLFVGYFLDQTLAESLALSVPGALDAGELHMTVCYAGDLAAIPDVDIMAAITRAKEAIEWSRILPGTINGVGRFQNTEDGKDTIVALVDVPGLAALHGELSGIFTRAGFPGSEHGFTAHISLAVVDAGSEFPIAALDRPYAITVDRLTINAGTFSEVVAMSGFLPDVAQFGEVIDAEGNVQEDGPRLFIPQRFSITEEGESWINYLPEPGTYKRDVKIGGEVVDTVTYNFTPESNADYVAKFEQGVYQRSLPVDVEHGIINAGAVGWIEEMKLTDDGRVDARVKWNDRGQQLLANDRFRYFSPEIFDEWPDPVTGVVHKNVATGGALTKKPFFKDASLRPIRASEDETPSTPKEEPNMSDNPTTPTSITPAQFSELKAEFEAEKLRSNQFAEQLKAKDDTIAKQSEDIQKLQLDARVKRFAEVVDGKSANGIRWFGDRERHMRMLTTLAQQFGEDSAEVTDYIQTNHDAAMRVEKAVLNGPIGGNYQPEPDSAAAALEAKVNQFSEAHPEMTRAAVKAKVMEDNPQLVERERVEKAMSRG